MPAGNVIGRNQRSGGRGLGPCGAGYGGRGWFGRGGGRGRGRGRGMGWGFMPGRVYDGYNYGYQLSKDDEMKMMEDEVAALKQELESFSPNFGLFLIINWN